MATIKRFKSDPRHYRRFLVAKISDSMSKLYGVISRRGFGEGLSMKRRTDMPSKTGSRHLRGAAVSDHCGVHV